MSEWIEINLPWDAFNETRYVGPPNMNKRIKREFGCLLDDLKKDISAKEWTRYHDLSAKTSNTYMLSGEDLFKKLEEIHPKSAAIKKVVAYHRLSNQIHLWCEAQSEWIEYKRKSKEQQELFLQKSFSGRGLNKPGTLVEVQTSEGVSVFLIGHINPICGVCDDCTGFDPYSATVLRYKIVWEPQENKPA